MTGTGSRTPKRRIAEGRLEREEVGPAKAIADMPSQRWNASIRSPRDGGTEMTDVPGSLTLSCTAPMSCLSDRIIYRVQHAL